MSEPRWTIQSIKSPWLRIPTAWLFASVTVVIYLVFLLAFIVEGAASGSLKGAREFWKISGDLPGKVWRIMTSLERKP